MSPPAPCSRLRAGREAITRAAEYLGTGVANAVVLLHPDLIVLGGGLAGTGSLLFDTVREILRSCVRVFRVDDIRDARQTDMASPKCATTPCKFI